ncbi:MAG: hypothetical protein K0R00_138 [Herbinix sp.]|jgi:hypothetical protein|nr:hypothetical protein [Herbinix sp.]
MKLGVKVFTLPGEEVSVEAILNNPDFVVVEQNQVPCPKEGIILYFLKWEDHREEEN